MTIDQHESEPREPAARARRSRPRAGEPLRGFGVAVTANRRAGELIDLLERRGARVSAAPAMRIVALADDTELLAATRACLSARPDVVVATTGVGLRGWVEAADGWGLGERLREAFAAADLIARGPKAAGAIRSTGCKESWSPASESSREVLEHLRARGVDGLRVAVQLHGEPEPELVEGLVAAGADVVAVPVYRWAPPADLAPLTGLVEAVATRGVDAVAFTSKPAVAGFLTHAEHHGRREAVLEALRRDVLAACVGPVTAEPLQRLEVVSLQPERPRLGALVRAITEELPRRATALEVAEHRVEIRGHAVFVDATMVTLSPAPMAMLRALAENPGHVLSRAQLVGYLPGGEATSEHAVEMAVTRLRAGLGDPRFVETVVKRGYRLGVAR